MTERWRDMKTIPFQPWMRTIDDLQDVIDELVAALKTVAQQHALFVGPDDDIANATKEVVRAALAKAERDR